VREEGGGSVPVRSEFNDPVAYNAATAAEFRANGGEVSGDFAGRPLLLLTTVGARTGLSRTTPLIYTKDGESFVVTAADGGVDHHPGWYHNLLAEPKVTVEVGSLTLSCLASEPKGAERDRLFADRVAATPRFGEYQAKTTRQIPIILLTPEAS
jgi:deazaflavin-dependent oxidoreductase (nitroreductase family)